MPYLIDGHNLIPKISGLSLRQMDDEQALLELLQEFCRRQRKQVEVFFDNAPPEMARTRTFGTSLLARFVRRGTTADSAIHKRLEALGKAARNWIVVSSDQAVQSGAREVQARVMPSEAFAELLQDSLRETRLDQGKKTESGLSPEEVDEWLKIFKGNKPKS
jgi:uncharacterized protein